MPNAYAGAFPWSRSKTDHPTREDARLGFTWNAGTAVATSKHKDYVPRPYSTGGWTEHQPNKYNSKPQKPEMMSFKLYNGRTTKVPIGDVETFIGFRKMTPQEVTAAIEAEVNAAWDHDSGKGKYYTAGGQGHIASMRYNPSFQILEVTFGSHRPDTVTFFRIPVGHWLELQLLAKDANAMMMGVDGTQRHSLGVRFWDLIRVRGQRTGARYQFTYTTQAWTGGPSNAAENMERMYSTYANKQPDAHEEAVINNKETPSFEEARKEKQEDVKKNVKMSEDYKGYTAKEGDKINYMADMMVENRAFDVRHPIWDELEVSIKKGWGEIIKFAAKYNLSKYLKD